MLYKAPDGKGGGNGVEVREGSEGVDARGERVGGRQEGGGLDVTIVGKEDTDIGASAVTAIDPSSVSAGAAAAWVAKKFVPACV